MMDAGMWGWVLGVGVRCVRKQGMIYWVLMPSIWRENRPRVSVFEPTWVNMRNCTVCDGGVCSIWIVQGLMTVSKICISPSLSLSSLSLSLCFNELNQSGSQVALTDSMVRSQRLIAVNSSLEGRITTKTRSFFRANVAKYRPKDVY